MSLAAARTAAADARAHLADGLDPRAAKSSDRTSPAFGEVADRHIETMEPRWRNTKHRDQWRMTLNVYAEPLRGIPVDQISTKDVLGVLQPIWHKIPETASRLRGRIEAVLDAAQAQGLRSGPNPAAWNGNLKFILQPPPKMTRGHQRAMPIDDVPQFMCELRSRDAVAARCLEFAVLTCAHTGEALGARWEEIDLKRRVWVIPAERMRKSGRQHKIPLATRAIAILEEMFVLSNDSANRGYVFPGQRRDQPLSNMALLMLLRRMNVTATMHGFRSTFRDWAGDHTEFARELAEHALAHQIGNKSELAYRRSSNASSRPIGSPSRGIISPLRPWGWWSGAMRLDGWIITGLGWTIPLSSALQFPSR